MINSYFIRNVNGEEVLYLNFDFSYEFSSFDFMAKREKIHDVVRNFIKDHNIIFKGATIALVSGGILFGSINLIENLKLLLDIFYNTDINEKNVSEEKGIIGEEIDMYKDRIDSLLNDHLYFFLLLNIYHLSLLMHILHLVFSYSPQH